MQIENMKLAEIIMEYHQKYGGILGYRRMCSFINCGYKKNYNTKRMCRIMNILGVHSTIRRARRCCTVSNKRQIRKQKTYFIASLKYLGRMKNEQPMQWNSQFLIFMKKLYLSAFLDLYDCSIIAWVISKQNEIIIS